MLECRGGGGAQPHANLDWGKSQPQDILDLGESVNTIKETLISEKLRRQPL